MKHLMILFGGASNEHEVSLRSAAAVYRHLPAGYRTSVVYITRDGEWYLYKTVPEISPYGVFLPESTPYVPLCVSLAPRGTFITPDGERLTPDVIFPVLHGQNCEDGRLQGFLDSCGIPYVGPGTAASVLGMDKAAAKQIVVNAGIPVADWLLVTRNEITSDIGLNAAVRRIETHFSAYPVFVKAVNSGSSVGAFRVNRADELRPALCRAAAVDSKILVEEFVTGKEIEVAVLERAGHLTVSVPGEVESGAAFYDYDAKYKTDTSRVYIPARLPASVLDSVSAMAGKVFTLLGCRQFSRVDFFVAADGRILFNEINTLPGFTSISMYPKLMEACGISFSDLIRILVEEAAR